MNIDEALALGANRAKADGMYVEFYRDDILIGERKSGSSGNAMSDAATFRNEYARIRKESTR